MSPASEGKRGGCPALWRVSRPLFILGFWWWLFWLLSVVVCPALPLARCSGSPWCPPVRRSLRSLFSGGFRPRLPGRCFLRRLWLLPACGRLWPAPAGPVVPLVLFAAALVLGLCWCLCLRLQLALALGLVLLVALSPVWVWSALRSGCGGCGSAYKKAPPGDKAGRALCRHQRCRPKRQHARRQRRTAYESEARHTGAAPVGGFLRR